MGKRLLHELPPLATARHCTCITYKWYYVCSLAEFFVCNICWHYSNIRFDKTYFPNKMVTTDSNSDVTAKSFFNGNVVDLSTASTFDISDLRLAFQIQKWMERNAEPVFVILSSSALISECHHVTNDSRDRSILEALKLLVLSRKYCKHHNRCYNSTR